jgi:formyl-CoA transferase
MIYQTSDHRFLVLVSANPDKEWPGIARALGHPEWLDDPRFASIRDIMKQRDQVRAMFQSAFADMTLQDACKALDGESLTYSVIERISDVVQSAHLIENEVIVATESEDPNFQWTVANPISLASQQARAVNDPPKLGEHTRGILQSLGYDEVSIADLIETGVVKTD